MGGDFIIGIEEDKGIPIKIDGIKINNIDDYKNRLDSIIRDSIIPRLPSVNIRESKLSNGNYIIIIRINKSWLAPHQVVQDGLLYSRENGGRFYKRHTGGKHPMDVYELKDAFLQSEILYKKIENFREIRINDILELRAPIQIKTMPYVVLHIIPISNFYFESGDHFNLKKCYDEDKYFKPILFCSSNSGNIQFLRKYNFEGLVKYYNTIQGYTQVYRNGTLEAIESNNFFRNIENFKYFNISYFEEKMINSISLYLDNYKQFNIEPPFAILITLLNIKDYEVKQFQHNFYLYGGEHSIDRNNLILPELLIKDFNSCIEKELKKIFDMIWNAYSLPYSFNYDKNEKWILMWK